MVSNEEKMSNFQQLEVVGRGSEPQLQVGENLKQCNLAQHDVLRFMYATRGIFE